MFDGVEYFFLKAMNAIDKLFMLHISRAGLGSMDLIYSTEP